MGNMQESMAYPDHPASLDLPAWKGVVSAVSAVLLGLLFLVAGLWKITDPIEAAARLAQARVPGVLSEPFSVMLGVTETFAAVLLFVPRFRRWGALITGVMLVAFMAWVGFYYAELTGKECSCFPWLKRAVGPGFFIGDLAMLAAAALAWIWAKPPQGVRGAALILTAVAVFGGASYGVMAARMASTRAPASVQVDGQPYSLQEGRVFLYFFDPECLHCLEAARTLAGHKWKETALLAAATRVPQFATGFLATTGLKARLTTDTDQLKATFPFGDPPFGVFIENGRQKAAFAIFDSQQPSAKLRDLGLIE
jgi:hypothetical protein